MGSGQLGIHYLLILGYLKDSNAAAHSVDSDILYAVIHSRSFTTLFMMTHRWRPVIRRRDKKKAYSDLNYV